METRGRFGLTAFGLFFALLLAGCSTVVRGGSAPAVARPIPGTAVQVGGPTVDSKIGGAVQFDRSAVQAALAKLETPPTLTAESLEETDEAIFTCFRQLESWTAEAMVLGGSPAGPEATGWVLAEDGRAALLETLENFYSPPGAKDQFEYYYSETILEDGSTVYVPRNTAPLGGLPYIETALAVDIRPQAVIVSGQSANADAHTQNSFIDQTFLLADEPDGTYRIAGVSYNNR